MKGTVYSGVVYMPQHPAADMSGLLRAATRCRNQIQAEINLSRYGIILPPQYWWYGLWRKSQSASELHATETHYGEVLVCPLALAFLKPENYQPLTKDYLIRKPGQASGSPEKSGSQPQKAPAGSNETGGGAATHAEIIPHGLEGSAGRETGKSAI